MAESEEELKNLLLRVKESEKADLKLTIQKTKIMASSPITSWQIEAEKVKAMTDFIFFGSKITVDGDCSHEIKKHLLLGRKTDKLRQHIKKQRHHFADKSPYSQTYGFSSRHVWIESRTVKKPELRRTDAFKLLHCRRFFRIPWTTRRSNQSILKVINPEYSLEGLMLKHQFFGYLMQKAHLLEKTLILGKIEDKRRRG